jgi:hypothetical protein
MLSKTQNYINHVCLVLDASTSMFGVEKDVIKVADNQVAYLAQRSKELNQETRITIYSFNHKPAQCLVYDMDVLRVPSIASLYNVQGMTALIDATLLSIDDLKMTPEKYGEHAFLIYVLTDGQENSSAETSYRLQSVLSGLPDNWTLACFVPDQTGKFEAKKFGFHADNIAIWDATSTRGVAEAGEKIRQTTETFMTGRSSGVRGYKSLFKLNTLSPDDITRNLKSLTFGSYSLRPVLFDQRADDFCTDNFGMYVHGTVFYELMKKEKVQAYKQVAVQYNNRIFSGPDARRILGLPDDDVDVIPSSHPHYKIYVQSTAPNRKLIKGTQVLIVNFRDNC